MFVAMVSGVVLLPLLSREVDRGDATVAKDLVNLYWGGFLAIGLPFVVGCVLLSRPLLSLLANDEVAVAAAWVVPLVGASALFYGGSVILGNLLVVHLRTPEMLKANVAAAICNVSLNLLLIMWWRDITAAAVAALAGYAAGFLWTWRACHSTAGFRLQAPFLGASLGATAVMGAAIVVVLHAAPHLETSFGGAAALVLGGMVVYGAAFVALAVPGLASVRRHFQAAALRVAP
jgi:O-antigen/teichoic acid export membrane protein